MLDDEARERLTPALAARKLVDFSGPHGWDYSATNLGAYQLARLRAVRRSVRRSSDGCCRSSSCEPTSSFRAPSCATPTAAPTTSTSSPLDKAAHQIAVAENVAVFHGWPGAITGIVEATPHEQPQLGDAADGLPATGRGRRRAAAVQRDHGAIRAGARTRAVPAGRRDRRARRLPAARSPAQRSSKVRSSGHRAWRERSCSACAAATSCSSAARTSRSATTHTTTTWCACICEESFSFHVATPEAAVALKP